MFLKVQSIGNGIIDDCQPTSKLHNGANSDKFSKKKRQLVMRSGQVDVGMVMKKYHFITLKAHQGKYSIWKFTLDGVINTKSQEF